MLHFVNIQYMKYALGCRLNSILGFSQLYVWQYKGKKIINDIIKTNGRDKINASKGYDCVISFGYRHILKQSVVEELECPIFNSRISYLPYNRGAQPNVWSFCDGTLSGVTIHLMDGGDDTGPTKKQKYIKLNGFDETFLKNLCSIA